MKDYKLKLGDLRASRQCLRLGTNCSDKTNKQIGNVFVSPFVLMSVFLFCVVK